MSTRFYLLTEKDVLYILNIINNLKETKEKERKDMAFCKNCGKEIEDNATICVHCGVLQETRQTVVDNGGFGWGLLGCCIPIVGLILFLVWKDTKPKTAKAAGVGALVSVIASIIFYIIYFVIIVGLIGVSAGMSGL